MLQSPGSIHYYRSQVMRNPAARVMSESEAKLFSERSHIGNGPRGEVPMCGIILMKTRVAFEHRGRVKFRIE